MSEPIVLNNRYQLQEPLGTGGMAMVYRAHDLMLERDVAIKILREDYSKDPAFRERFRQEAKAAANLSHPNIVTVHDFGYDTGRLFIVMEHIPGTDLKTILQRRGRFQTEEAISLIIQSCAGVGYAHRVGLVHCDIKPQNMLITPDKRLKVTDFGIARALSSIKPEEKTDVVWGSPQYFSPEQAAGLAPSPASDVYSLGVVFYEMLTGRLPFAANSAEELARMHREDPPPSPRNFIPTLPAPLEQIAIKVLSKEPSARYRTADQFGRVLVNVTKQINAATTVTPSSHPASQISTAPRVPNQNQAPAKPQFRNSFRPPSNYSQPAPIRQYVSSYTQEEENPLDIDWTTIALGLAALIAVGGLVPFWMWIYFLYQ